MLDRHPAIASPGEFDFLFDAFGPDGGVAAAQALGPQALDEFLRDDRIYLLHSQRMPEGADNATRLRSYVDLLSGGSGWLALNLHRNFLSAQQLFPQARFIHLIRDPRDCARSSIGMGWAGNVYFGLDPWIHAEASWDRLSPHLRKGQALQVQYEEMVAHPQEVLSRVCRFLGLAYDARMLELGDTTYSPPSAAFANQWQRHMSEGDVKLVEARVGDIMRARGYALRHEGADAPGTLARLGLKLQDAVFRHRHRARHYGTPLWLQEMLARRLRLQSWLRQLRHRMIAIDSRHLK
jgi:hypothetical protein